MVARARRLQLAEDGAVDLQFSEVPGHRLRVAVDPGTPAPVAQRLGKDAQQLLPVPPVALDGACPPQSLDVSVPRDGIFGFEFEDALPGSGGFPIQTEVGSEGCETAMGIGVRRRQGAGSVVAGHGLLEPHGLRVRSRVRHQFGVRAPRQRSLPQPPDTAHDTAINRFFAQ